jgi:hypothetical protein
MNAKMRETCFLLLLFFPCFQLILLAKLWNSANSDHHDTSMDVEESQSRMSQIFGF